MAQPSLKERFESRYCVTAYGCWEWLGHTASTGYGQIMADGRNVTAHRAAWTLLRGPIPANFHVDHLCRNPSCVNPSHLEPVPAGINIFRGKIHNLTGHCKRGHAWTTDNLMARTNGTRECKTCHRERERARLAKLA